MRMFILKLFLFFYFLISPYKTTANTFRVLYERFLPKSKEASLILKKIENTLKKDLGKGMFKTERVQTWIISDKITAQSL